MSDDCTCKIYDEKLIYSSEVNAEPGIYFNSEIDKNILDKLKKDTSDTRKQIVYISNHLPSGHWQLKLDKQINKKSIIVKMKTFQNKNVMAPAVISWAIFFIETNKTCNINFLEKN